MKLKKLTSKTHSMLVGFALLTIVTACNLPGNIGLSQPEPTPTIPISVTATPAPSDTPVVIEHRIGIREVPSGMEFYDRLTGERFVPRGADYVHWVSRPSPGRGDIWVDALFNTSFGELDQAEAELQQMKALGFNTVRMWKNACWGEVGGCIGDPAGGLSDAYLDNITEFLRLAKQYGIFVIFTDDWVPDDGGYSQELARAAYVGYNGVYLTEHGINAERMVWVDLIQGLIERSAALDAVLAYELKNEAFYEADSAPLNRNSGTVTTANGNTYDMADEADKKRMMEEGWLYWIEQVRDSIQVVDPTALVTMGFFVQQEPNRVREGDLRLVYLDRVVRESQLDFLDFHAYPGYDLSIQGHAENFAMLDSGSKLIVMGEFGADKHNYATAERAAAALQAWQVDSCDYGFDGWLFWTWGINPQDEFWNGYEGEGVVSTVLAPVNRPDPCAYGEFDFIRFNVAPQAVITASSYAAGFPPQQVADESQNYWNSSAGAPQWVQLALATPAEVESIVLTVAQQPPGRSVHEIWVRQTDGKIKLLYTFDGVTNEGDVLTFQPNEPLVGVDLVRVVTTSVLDLWPAWHEIEILTKTLPE
ncbi:MAG: cellulase family glycosylhydrolase [Anaerolineales bacterium]|uniref:Cellulase family glycosylhydrolase n=1 Tax=Candidatus Desulfolinea nitratireducens TaxID=2841698 RepID=A0A8J6NJ60_9CHLR|nr:cellulase family glycosylhydrolase [Candidatus Desulfolinea nitratireducens]MBL6961767.1 cellulase family glycosylhydrolase [Anaerolineales bacterium]